MSETVEMADRRAAAEYVPPRKRRDGCQGCQHARMVTYQSAAGVSYRCDRIRVIVSALARCRWWEAQR